MYLYFLGINFIYIETINLIMSDEISDKQYNRIKYVALASSLSLVFVFSPLFYFYFDDAFIAVAMAVIGAIDYPVIRYIILPNLETSD